ncbi:hypothetical protein HZA43_00285 [Candidatus Peregrinibacteria bacterium]|nr:hypothetical protein [Candidatus Peregrinibacteria bacterium]
MADLSKIAKIRDLLSAAEASIRSAGQLLSESFGLGSLSALSSDREQYAKKASFLEPSAPAVAGRVIEGVFDGQGMVDKKGKAFPVPANYASKSKLIPGDILKLTITDDGKFLYKQIGPVERKTVVGPLVYNNAQYQVLANGKAYNVLLASVTYFRAEAGDEVTLIIPANEESDWGAIEAVLPKFDDFHKGEEETEKPKTKSSRKSKAKESPVTPETPDDDFKI